MAWQSHARPGSGRPRPQEEAEGLVLEQAGLGQVARDPAVVVDRRAAVSGSTWERWLSTITKPPSAGKFSSPAIHSRLVVRNRVGLMIATATPIAQLRFSCTLRTLTRGRLPARDPRHPPGRRRRTTEHLTGSTRGRGRGAARRRDPREAPGDRQVAAGRRGRPTSGSPSPARSRSTPSAACLATDAASRGCWSPPTTPGSPRPSTALGAEACPDGGNGLNRRSSRRPRRPPAGGPPATGRALRRPAGTSRRTTHAALESITGRPAYVADAAGTGTTLYTASYDDFAPRFGVDSAAPTPLPAPLRSRGAGRAPAGRRRPVSLRAAIALG